MGPEGEREVLVDGKGGRTMVGMGGYSLEGVEVVGEEATEEATEGKVAADEAVDVVTDEAGVEVAADEAGPAIAEDPSARV